MRVILLSSVIAVSGCTSAMLDQRKSFYEAADKCAIDGSSPYFSATKQDVVITIAPLASLTGIPCDKYSGVACDNIATAWLLIAPFTAIDTPFALVKDLYMLPNDIDHMKKSKNYHAAHSPNKP